MLIYTNNHTVRHCVACAAGSIVKYAVNTVETEALWFLPGNDYNCVLSFTPSFPPFRFSIEIFHAFLMSNVCSPISYSVIFFFFLVKGPAADATDAQQLWGLLCNPVMKMISLFFSFFLVMEHRWNEIYRGKPKYSGGKTYTSATLSTTNPTWTPGIEPGPPRWEAGD
jgi:hypothetical protein